MKWPNPTGSVQRSSCEIYLITQANSMDWVAYYMPRGAKVEEIAVRPNDESARTACDEHARIVSRRA
jgi:hypothetical protein